MVEHRRSLRDPHEYRTVAPEHPACRDRVAHTSGPPEPFDLTKLA